MSDETGKERGSYRSGLGFGTLSFALSAFVGIASAIVTARLYGAHVIGEYALAYAPTAAVWYLSSVREQAGLVRQLATLPPRAPRVTGLFWAVFGFSTTLTIGVAAIATAIVWFVFHGPIDQPSLFAPAVVSLAGYVVFTNPGWNLDSIFSAFVSGRRLFWIRLHQGLANLVIAVAIGVVWPTVWGLILSTIGAAATTLVHRLIAIRPIMRLRVAAAEVREGLRALPGIIGFGVRAAPGALIGGVCSEIGTWVLGATSSIAAVGAYNRAWMLGRKFVELNFRITEILLPTLVRRRSEGDHAGFDRALVDTMRYTSLGMLLIAAAGGGPAEAVMRVFGTDFVRAADALAILLALPLFQTLSGIQSQAFFAVDRPLLTTMTALLRLAVTLAATILGVQWLGLAGAAAGLVAGAAAEVLLKLVILRGLLSASLASLWGMRSLVAMLAAYAAGFGAARAVDSALPYPYDVLVAPAAGVAAYVAVLLATGGLGSRDRERIRQLRARLSRRRDAAVDPATTAAQPAS